MSKDNPIGTSAMEEAFGPAVRAEEPGRAGENPDMEIAYPKRKPQKSPIRTKT